MQKLRKLLAPCEDFRADVARYTPLDALLALVFAACFILSIVAGLAGNWGGLLGDIIWKYSAALIIYLLLFLRRQGAASLGLRWEQLGRSALIGLAASALAMPLAAFICISLGQQFGPAQIHMFLPNFTIMIFKSGIPEELIFRGFVGKRLYGGLTNKPVALLLGGVLFALTHIPALALGYGGSWLAAAAAHWPLLLTCVVMHLVNMLLYAKTNNLAAPILLHTLWNLAQSCFN